MVYNKDAYYRYRYNTTNIYSSIKFFFSEFLSFLILFYCFMWLFSINNNLFKFYENLNSLLNVIISRLIDELLWQICLANKIFIKRYNNIKVYMDVILYVINVCGGMENVSTYQVQNWLQLKLKFSFLYFCGVRRLLFPTPRNCIINPIMISRV